MSQINENIPERVTILEGVIISSTEPGHLSKEAGRTYTVKVNHTISGKQVCVGHRDFDKNGEKEGESLTYMNRHDKYDMMELFGTDVLESITDHMIEGKIYYRFNGTSHCSLFIETQGPSVRWAGSGGYWNEVSMSDIPELSKEGK